MCMCIGIYISFRRACISHGLIEGGILFWALTYHEVWHRPLGWATGEKSPHKIVSSKRTSPYGPRRENNHSVFLIDLDKKFNIHS